MGAAKLTLQRVGWSWPHPLRLQDEQGREIVLTAVAPAMLSDLLVAAQTAQHERHAVASLRAQGICTMVDTPEASRRISTAAVRNVLRAQAKPLSAREAGSLQSVAAAAVWTHGAS